MESRRFFIELPEHIDELEVYDALKCAGIQYARVKPADPEFCERSDRCCQYSTPQRKRGEGIG